jgi:hypothetical protein
MRRSQLVLAALTLQGRIFMFSNAFTQPQQFVDTWNRLAKQQLDRLETLAEQMAKLQGQHVERAHEAIDESAKLMKESITYANQLASEWRKLSIESTRKATEMVGG